MDKAEYIKTQMTILNLGQQASRLDLEGFISQISKAETVAPILDPTLYRKAQDNLEAFKNLARALLPVKTAFEAAFETVLRTAARGGMEPPSEPSKAP